ncbi:PKD domain-containing protein [Catenovulum sp. SM1970]|uniref:PKD domain-containing protein n=1 Tax=Marinifaba aquimaris TaxID=2741323 RepID=UPI001573601D|nr:PKD domain-containing protein [Marinifaba aquimaris]NTS76439.1 PKD domain-containing protein [Marinifaba aquimaris]
MKLTRLIGVLAMAYAVPVFSADIANTNLTEFTSTESITDIGKKQLSERSINSQLSSTDTFSQPGASFIKLHFKNLVIPEGAKVIVRNTEGTERYEYTAQSSNELTLSSNDDGSSSFSAMSITGSTAVVEYLTVDAEQTITGQVDYFYYGDESEPQFEPLSTCGVNERVDVQCWANSHPTEVDRSRPVARLLIGGRSLCTAWRVGDSNHMFTNNHCVETAAELASTEIWFNYQSKTCNGWEKETVVKVTPKDFLKTDITLDYTLFTINNLASVSQFGYLGLDVRNANQGERIYIPQHGSGNPKELSIESDRDSNGLCQVNDPTVNGGGYNTDIGYYCDTIGGSSGSPVIAASTNNVIALHHLGGCYNKGAQISRIWPQVSSFFGGVIPKGDNGSTPTKPIADISANCNALTCSFDATGSSSPDGAIAAYSWQFGDGQSSNSATPSHSYASSGSYTVSLTVTDTKGLSSQTTQSVTVRSASDSVLKKGVAKTGLTGSKDSETFYTFEAPTGASNVQINTSSGTGDVDLYVKRNAKPTTSSYDCRPYKNGNSESCALTTGAGTYHVMLKGYSSYSGVRLVADYTLGGTNQAPVSDFSFSANQLSVSFTQQATDDKAVTAYQWSFGDGSQSTQASPTHSYAQAGSYQVSLVVTDADGATDTSTKTVTVTSSGNGGTGCSGIETWSSSAVYTKDDTVSYNGTKYQAKWWTKGDNPSTNSTEWAVWKDLGSCN